MIALLTVCFACGRAIDPEPVGSDFAPVAGKYYVAYVYVEYLSEDGFAGGGTFRDSVYVNYPGADQIFKLCSTVRVVFDGADYVAETRSFDFNTTQQSITKVKEARLSDNNNNEPVFLKPIIYLYPEEETVCSVKLDLRGRITCSYPDYGGNGWDNFIAAPDGTLTFPDGGKYYALYWEGSGTDNADFDMSSGFCVRGEDTAEFLANILPRLGLNEKEANEFIIYWLPRMQDNPYNLISFQGKVYEDNVKLLVEPSPDTLIRTFMVFRPMSEAIYIEPQVIVTPERIGFTVVEWGGSEIR